MALSNFETSLFWREIFGILNLDGFKFSAFLNVFFNSVQYHSYLDGIIQ